MRLISTEGLINKEQIMLLCSRTLMYYDARLVDHGERVAYIAWRIGQKINDSYKINYGKLILLCLFHDIGAYKTEDIDRIIEFETDNVQAHSIYGYLFLKYFSPLKDLSEVILYHHCGNEKYRTFSFEHKHYANLIHLSDRIDMGLRAGMPMSEIKSRLNDDKFDSNQVQAFLEVLSEENIEHTIESGMYRKEIWSEIARYPATEEDVLHFIQMLVYTIDFKSPHTVNHSVNTTFISLFLAQKFGLNDRMQDMIYIAALLHDIGKVCIPVEILENPGKLSEGDMHIMRQHVSYSEEILDGTFAQDIVEMAVRHHEKLDGTGYPRGLTAGELTIPQRIVAVADICSALLSRRSYKDSYSKERTLLILKEMSEAGLVDEEGVSILTENFDELIQLLVEVNEPVQVMYQNIMEEYTKINKRAILH